MVERRCEPADFSTLLGLKDVGLALGAATDLALSLPTAIVVQEALMNAVQAAWSHRDWWTLAEVSRSSPGAGSE